MLHSAYCVWEMLCRLRLVARWDLARTRSARRAGQLICLLRASVSRRSVLAPPRCHWVSVVSSEASRARASRPDSRCARRCAVHAVRGGRAARHIYLSDHARIRNFYDVTKSTYSMYDSCTLRVSPDGVRCQVTRVSPLSGGRAGAH